MYTTTTNPYRRGNILLLALLLLAGGIVGGLTVATLVVADLRQANTIDNGLIAYAKAESGLEQTLYEVRQANWCDTPGRCNSLTTDYQNCNLPYSTTDSFNVTVGCDRKIIPASVVLMPYLEENQTFQMDFSPALFGPLPCASAECTFTVAWNRVSPAQLPSLEVTYVDLYQNKLRVYRPYLGLPYRCNAGINDTACTKLDPVTDSNPLKFPILPDESGASLYQVRFRALGAPITGLKITSNASNAAGYLDIWSRGTQSGAKQTLETVVPKRAPAYGFSDYVIFSEQDINK